MRRHLPLAIATAAVVLTLVLCAGWVVHTINEDTTAINDDTAAILVDLEQR